MNWYYGRSYNLQTTDIRIDICIWIHMIAIRPTYQRTFEFILKYELILRPFIQPTNKERMNSYMYMNSYDGRSYNLSTDIWICTNIWIDIMGPFIQHTHKGHMNSYIYMNSYDGCSYNLSMDIWVWIDIMAVHTTYKQSTYEFIYVYEFIWWPFV